MKNYSELWVMWFVLGIFGLLVLFSGCVSGPRERETLAISGSTTVQPIATSAADVFMADNPGVIVTIQGGGSGTGIKMVAEGSVDIGGSSRELKESEIQQNPDLRPYAVAADGIAIAVHPSNTLAGLTKQQVQDIFAGRITNFRDVGGSDREIVIVIREEGSGTRGTFEELVMGDSKNSEDSLQKPSNGAVKSTIASNENAIGYLGVGYLDGGIKAISVNGVFPSEGTIKDGSYPVSRNLYMITRGYAKGLAKEFIDFVLSGEGQEIVEEEGFVSVI